MQGGIKLSMSLSKGSILEGLVTGITKFGAFVQLPGGETGLVHISEIANTYVKDVNEYLQKDDVVKVKVLSIGDDGKVGLSIKQAQETEKEKARDSARQNQKFEDKLTKFMKESDERQQDLKRHTEAKRGGRGGPYGQAF